MEEKERYELLDDNCIYDNELKEYVVSPTLSMRTYLETLTKLFNQRDTRIKELEKENKQLKQQLSDEKEAHELCISHYTEAMEDLRKQLKFECDARNRFVKRVSQLNESQNVVAIEELNKLRRLYKKKHGRFWDGCQKKNYEMKLIKE